VSASCIAACALRCAPGGHVHGRLAVVVHRLQVAAAGRGGQGAHAVHVALRGRVMDRSVAVAVARGGLGAGFQQRVQHLQLAAVGGLEVVRRGRGRVRARERAGGAKKTCDGWHLEWEARARACRRLGAAAASRPCCARRGWPGRTPGCARTNSAAQRTQRTRTRTRAAAAPTLHAAHARMHAAAPPPALRTHDTHHAPRAPRTTPAAPPSRRRPPPRRLARQRSPSFWAPFALGGGARMRERERGVGARHAGGGGAGLLAA
jgi:hypothetical protein